MHQLRVDSERSALHCAAGVGQQNHISKDDRMPQACAIRSSDQTHVERLLPDAGTNILQSLDAVMTSRSNAPGKGVLVVPSKDRDQANERLLWVAEHGDVEALFLALGKGADVIGKDALHGKTALHWAAEGGHISITCVLLERGCDVASLDRYGETPLHHAADSGREKIVE